MKRTGPIEPPSAWLLLFMLMAAGLSVGGCARKIGDGCATSADCDPNGTRVCDLSQTGGYCSIDGCDDKSCPEDSVCIRTFPEKYLTHTCDPYCEDAPVASCGNNISVSCPCAGAPTDDCTADEVCLDSGLCARRAFERRYCARTCSDNGDCRDGYECRVAGTRGSMALLSTPRPIDAGAGPSAQFCAQRAD